MPSSKSSIQSVKIEDRYTNNDKEIANQVNKFFTSIGKSLADKFEKPTNENNNSPNIDKELKFHFDFVTPVFIFDEICKMSSKKATGLDNLSIRLLKLAAPIVCDSLAYICNLSLFTSNFPSAWKKARVTPIFKEGDKSDVNNYRPISVLPVISKIIERSVHNQLYDFLTKNELLNSCQSGFRKNHSTTTTLLDVSDHILNNMNQGKLKGALFIDIKKAFDTVNHDLLLKKLQNYGIDGDALSWFASYLSDRTQSVCINSILSDVKQIDIGIPQGSILGPLLFIIYVNSLPDCVDCKCVMYADDTTLLFSANDHATLQENMNNSLSKIAHWFKSNQLTLNIKKTKYMIFGSKYVLNNVSEFELVYDTNAVERIDKFKYLGVIFDPLLSWCNHVDYISTIISKRIGVIRRVKFYLPSKTLQMLANAIVFPHFDYCSSVWSNFKLEFSNCLRILQNKLARVLLSADIRSPINDLMDALNWTRLENRWEKHLLVIVFKCLQHIAPSYLSSNFIYTSSVHSQNTRSQSSNTLVVPHYNINPGKRTFLYRGSSIWNKLPQNIRANLSGMSLSSFKLFL